MCLYVKLGTEVRKAKRNKLVYKYSNWLDDNNFNACIMRYNYERGVLQPYEHIRVNSYNQVEEGYHSIPFPRYLHEYRTGMFVIPRGTEFIEGYYDGKKCFVSSRIIYLGKYNFWNWLKYRLGFIKF